MARSGSAWDRAQSQRSGGGRCSRESAWTGPSERTRSRGGGMQYGGGGGGSERTEIRSGRGLRTVEDSTMIIAATAATSTGPSVSTSTNRPTPSGATGWPHSSASVRRVVQVSGDLGAGPRSGPEPSRCPPDNEPRRSDRAAAPPVAGCTRTRCCRSPHPGSPGPASAGCVPPPLPAGASPRPTSVRRTAARAPPSGRPCPGRPGRAGRQGSGERGLARTRPPADQHVRTVDAAHEWPLMIRQSAKRQPCHDEVCPHLPPPDSGSAGPICPPTSSGASRPSSAVG